MCIRVLKGALTSQNWWNRNQKGEIIEKRGTKFIDFADILLPLQQNKL